MVNSQEVVVHILSRLERGGSVKEVVNRTLDSLGVRDPKIRGFIYSYVFEISWRRNLIDFLISRNVLTKRKISREVWNILRVATFEMKVLGDNPAKVTNLAVEMAKKFGDWEAKFVNSICFSIEEEEIEELLDEIKEETKRVALEEGHPEWFVEYLFMTFGKEEGLKILEANNSKPPIWIRVNTLKVEPEKLIGILEKDGIVCEMDEDFWDVLIVREQKIPVVRTKAYGEGLFMLQDKASCSVAHALKPEPGEVILDMCSAPGAKSTHLAQLMGDEGKIYAYDTSKRRLERLKGLAKTLGIRSIVPILGDSRKDEISRVDKVLLDPPCSSTGNFRDNPQARWWFSPKRLRGLVKLQEELLKKAREFEVLTSYSTCSVLVHENEMLLEKFHDFRPVNPNVKASYGIKKFLKIEFKNWKKYRRFYPHLHNTDGFFLSLLEPS